MLHFNLSAWTVSLVLLVLALVSYCTAYQLPYFPETAKLNFNYQTVTIGQRLSQSTTAAAPTISLPSAATSSLYSIILIDPDAPSASRPIMSNWLHYLHTNLDGRLLSQPLTLATARLPASADSSSLSATYAPPTPPPGTGPHRYVALLYHQSASLPASPPAQRIEQPADGRRAKWSVDEWEQQAEAAGVVVTLVGGTYFVVEEGVEGDETSELSIKQDM